MGGAALLGVRADVTDEAAVAEALAATERDLGPVDVLVTCAGISGPVMPMAEYSLDDWGWSGST